MANNRYRLFEIVLYDDSEVYDFNDVIKNIKGFRKYAYIKHDKDCFEDDETIKKAHYHVVICRDNASTIDALSKKIGVPSNYIQQVRNERSCIRYLTHVDYLDKYQYEKSDIQCSRNYERFISKCFDDLETEQEILSNIFLYVDSITAQCSSYSDCIYHLIQYVNLNAYDTLYKRYRFEINDYLKSHL